jgi:phage tail tape-measure protein
VEDNFEDRAEKTAGTAGSVAGGISGAVLARSLVPVPFVGPVIGAVVGAALGSEVGRRLGRATINGGTAFFKTFTSPRPLPGSGLRRGRDAHEDGEDLRADRRRAVRQERAERHGGWPPSASQPQWPTVDSSGSPPGGGALCGLASPPGGKGLYFVDDATNTLDIFK